MKYLFLDDVRMPADAGNYMPLGAMYRVNSWDIVRNYEEFTEYITKNGLPDVISFDHDLAAIHYDPKTWREGFVYLEKTGYDCAKWLVNYVIENKKELPVWTVHSMNPVGRKNIQSYLENYEKTKNIL